MVRPKPSSKKKPTRGTDFKKFKHKLGRKLPPPKNATNTDIICKAIVLPEQSVAADKTGLAVTKKGFTLKELLQQSSHHNARVRKGALNGIRDLFQRHPEELRLHKLAVIEKLRERISDDDRSVRETLYQLFKSVVLPGCKEDNLEALISITMVYVFNAMTNLSVDVRLMAFKFLELLVEHHSSTFTANAEKILQNYEDILRKNKFHLEDKGKLKTSLSGLRHCLSLLPSNAKEDPFVQVIAERYILHAYEPDVQKDSTGYLCVIKRLKDVVPVLVDCFDDFMSMVRDCDHDQPQLVGEVSYDCDHDQPQLVGKVSYDRDHDQPQLIGKVSYDCMLSILESIDYAVSYFAYGQEKYQQDHTSVSPVKNDLLTLSHSFSPSLGKLFKLFPLGLTDYAFKKDDSRYFPLNVVISEIFFNLSKRISPAPSLLDKFLKFVEYVLLEKISRGEQTEQASHVKHLLSLISFLPRLVSIVDYSWRIRLIQAFTATFVACNPASMMKMACLLVIKEILLPQSMQHLDAGDPNILVNQSIWIQELPLILVSLGDTDPSCSKNVLSLLLHLGQVASSNTFLASEYDKIQPSFRAFFGNVPFVKLPNDCQELSLCCLYYFSVLDVPLLTSVASCCICHDLEPNIIFRIVEVLNSAYKAGHIQTEDQLSFFITLLSQLKVTPEFHDKVSSNLPDVQKLPTPSEQPDVQKLPNPSEQPDVQKLPIPSEQPDVQKLPTPSEQPDVQKLPTREVYKSITGVVCSFLHQMGDRSFIFQMVENIVLDLLSAKLPLDNTCAMIRMLAAVISKPAHLSEESIVKLSNILSGYLLDIAIRFSEDSSNSDSGAIQDFHYYLLPCLVMLDRSKELFKSVLDTMGSLVFASEVESCHTYGELTGDPSARVRAIVLVFSMLFKDGKMRRSLPSFMQEIDGILLNIVSLQSKEEADMGLEQNHRVRCAVKEFKGIIDALSIGTSRGY